MRTLLVMRHARAPPHQSDHDRPLDDEGVVAARRIGRMRADLQLGPRLPISSPALRARITAEEAIDAGRWGARLEDEPGLYQTSVEDVITTLALPPEVDRLMIVGHQPTWGSLVAHLPGEPVEMRTATVAVVGLAIDSWADIRSVRGSLVGVHSPPPEPRL